MIVYINGKSERLTQYSIFDIRYNAIITLLAEYLTNISLSAYTVHKSEKQPQPT